MCRQSMSTEYVGGSMPSEIFRLLIRLDPPRHHRRDLRKPSHPILTRFHNQLILRIRQISQYQALDISNIPWQGAHMIDTACNNHDQIFQFYRSILYFACSPECLSYRIEEYVGRTSIQCNSWCCLIVQPQTTHQSDRKSR